MMTVCMQTDDDIVALCVQSSLHIQRHHAQVVGQGVAGW